METEELTATLREAGLSPYQADAYVALLSLGSASAAELADESGVPRPRIYDVLRDLEAEGYVTTYEQDRLYAQATPPGELDPLRERLSRLESALDEIEARYRTPETRESDVTLVTQFETVFAQARRDVESAERHVQAVLTPEQFEELRETLAAAYDRGVYVQVSLYAPAEEVTLDPDDFVGVCTEVRRRGFVYPFLVITDRVRVSYAPPRHGASEYGVLVDDRWTAYVFHWFFLTSCWEMFETVHADPRDAPPITFVEITACVRYIEERLHEGATVHVTVDGYGVRTGRRRTLSGTVVDVDYLGHDDDSVASLAQLSARATLVVETADGTYTVGGEGAMTEDVSADRIVVERVERD
ncbi:TrmB family transcriptional regulator sugar-binding domain-containing protein [Salinigranum sp. GCM10025319]|uniref:TrmB family transcriptional regulator sugar-binding domain-containing protein n=1 Tax=Salinigranum sp. GCM10025319 TaxID=3252687 RepID=UPI00362372C2